MLRILALDGGGAHAGVMARALGAIYGLDEPGRDIIRRFAFIATNSGGSTVMAALCCGHTPREIATLYEDPASLKYLFSPRWFYYVPGVRRLRVIACESSVGKYAALTDVLDRKVLPGGLRASKVLLTDWPALIGTDVNFVIAAFDYDRERASFFRSDPNSPAASSSPANPATMVAAVHASTNAPISYFDRPAIVHRRRYWDGALAGYNNPVLSGVIEAIAKHPDRISEMRVLSIGSRAKALPFEAGIAKPWGQTRNATGLLTALKKATQVICDDPPDAASFHAYVALGQRLPIGTETVDDGMLVRLCPLLGPRWNGTGWDRISGVSDDDFQAMLDAPIDGINNATVSAIRRIGQLWLDGEVRNQPIRIGDHLRCDIGHETFAAGCAHWLKIST